MYESVSIGIIQTDRAVGKLRKLSLENDSILRVAVKSRGCSGLVYTLDYVKERGKFDEAVTQEGSESNNRFGFTFRCYYFG
jgi:Fe-S cluster assembly iron-binding protein IscA